MITIVAIGRKHEPWVAEGIERYQKRLKSPFDVEWVLLPHSSMEGDSARKEESGRIAARLADNQFVILLDETGTSLDSPALEQLLSSHQVHSSTVTFVIGGAYGVDERIHDRANTILSLSELVFPHQLVRLILIEQLYRAQEINRGGKYHHV
ncbi:23S rRNA (pseudouridine(1915)-N(3))-methyltransferase RlmH [Candidatus Saccharibacteria bacterium]|nr:23S rRNA (pseudouridine(1915)-N(3))-methyltransferase RlmH [Candidatus Saccharibacteria bacterium]